MRIIVLIAAFCLSLHARTIDVRYDVYYAFLPSVGTNTLHFESRDGRYRMETVAELHGLAAILAHHHREYHISIGAIGKEGVLIPERYVTIRTLDGYKRVRIYRFDHSHHRLLMHETIDVNETSKQFDPTSMHFVSTVQSHTYTRNITMPYDPYDDLLTLYFNIRASLGTLRPNETIRRLAAGADNGTVIIRRDEQPLHFTLFMEQDIFRNKMGEVHFITDKAFYVQKSVLKDVFLFGDLTMEREWLKESP